jgi:hypothetical protein
MSGQIQASGCLSLGKKLGATIAASAIAAANHRPDPMLSCAVLSLCADTALRIIRSPCLCSPLGIGAGPILIAGCGGKLSASFSKKACRSGYNIVIVFLNRFLLRKDLRGKFQLSRLRNIAQFLRLLVRLQQRAFSSLNHRQ